MPVRTLAGDRIEPEQMTYFGKYCLPLLTVAIASVLMAAVSCVKDVPEGDFSVSLQHEEVDAGKGSQFVTVHAGGDWCLTVSYSGSQSGWAQVTPESGSGDRTSVILSYLENISGEDRELALILSSEGREVSCTLVQKAPGQDGPDFPDTPSDAAVPEWMELPAVEQQEGTRFVMHDMTVGGIRTRNYSLCWSDADLVAKWVAYPLSSWTIGTEDCGRTDDWDFDPLIPEEYQPVLYRGFPSGGSAGYDRGHQIPSGDRQNYDSNRQTFYFTNMTPQLSGFNQNIWADLESKVRAIARSSDTLYVVTGCVVEGSTRTANDNEGKKVTVPAAYFKALLKYRKSGSTTGAGGYSAAAFYLEHRNYSQDGADASMLVSVDRLEELTGIDFFVNLSSAIGDGYAGMVESESPSPDVWLQ